MTIRRTNHGRHRNIRGGFQVAVFVFLTVLLIPFVVNQLGEGPPRWLRPFSAHSGTWVVVLTGGAIAVGIVLRFSPEHWPTVRVSAPRRAEIVAIAPASVVVEIEKERPIMTLPDRPTTVGPPRISATVTNTGFGTVGLNDWGMSLPGDRTIKGLRLTSCGIRLPRLLRPGGDAVRFAIDASAFRKVVDTEHVDFSDITVFVELSGGLRVHATAGVPLT